MGLEDGVCVWGIGFKKAGPNKLQKVITWRIYESIRVQVHCIAPDQFCISWQSLEPKDHPGLGHRAENKLTAALNKETKTLKMI